MHDSNNFQDDPALNSLSLAQISQYMLKIEEATSKMNSTFQHSIQKHEEQFIKAYKIKIYELTKLFHHLKKNIEDKFINNTITQQLETVMKERDYFKYESLKLNTQYNNVLRDYKNVTEQMVNVTQQMNIYKHLLENQKIKSSELQKKAKKLKSNLNDLTSKTCHEVQVGINKRQQDLQGDKKEQIVKLKKQIKQKTQAIRELKAKVQEFDQFTESKFTEKEQRKQLQEIFRSCVQSWKKQIVSKSRKFSSAKYSSPNIIANGNAKSSVLNFNYCSIEQFSGLQKKYLIFQLRQLLQMLFTNPQFLQFLEILLFDNKFEVQFKEVPDINDFKKDEILVTNRNRLYELMKKKGLLGEVLNKPLKFR